MELNHLNKIPSRRIPGIMDAEQQYAVLTPLSTGRVTRHVLQLLKKEGVV